MLPLAFLLECLVFSLPMKWQITCTDCEARLAGWTMSFPLIMESYNETADGVCGRCGYDLTGNTSGICPERGWNIRQRLHEADESKRIRHESQDHDSPGAE